MIPRELEGQILRLFHAERWPVNTIARELGVHHDAVERVLAQAGVPRVARARASAIDPFVPFIREQWARHPRLSASRLFAMCRERGYGGRPDHFRHMVARHRPPRPGPEAFLRLATLPGEQAQVDWAHFGTQRIGRGERPVVGLVIVLSWSRAIFLRFFHGMATEHFLRGHVEAFERWSGCARVCLYDNLKSAVLERLGDAIRFNPLLLDFAAHYRFEPRPVAKARGNEKGRVERSIRFIRGAFFAARPWRDLGDLNRQADLWCEGDALDRPWVEDRTRTVRAALEEERPKLLALPATPFPTEERREVAVGKTPYVRFDGNDYSVPHGLVRRTLVVLATPREVRVLDGAVEVARHPRSYDRRAQVEDPAHVAALVEAKRAARAHRGMDRLAHAAPSSRTLLERLAERGENLGSVTARLLRLLETYGAEALDHAILEALERDVPHPGAVQQVLERERAAAGRPPALPLLLPDDPRLRDLEVRPHPLSSYDAVGRAPAPEGPLPEEGGDDGRDLR
jgi:transposase